MLEPDFIRILEGPTPEFKAAAQLWNLSIHEGPVPADVELCEMRTGNGEDIHERAVNARNEGRTLQLDYPDRLRMREQRNVVAMRLLDGEAGTVLQLWVRQIGKTEQELMDDSSDSDDFNLFGDID